MSDPLNPACLSCSIERREVQADFVYSSDRWTVNQRVSEGGRGWPGWLVAQPRRHVTNLGDLTDVELKELGHVLALADEAIRGQHGAERTYFASLGLSADTHLHIHLVPQYDGAFQGPEAFSAEPTTSVDEIPPMEVLPSASQAGQFGLARIVEVVSRWLRRWSPYAVVKGLYRRWARSKSDPPGVWVAAEIYTFVWLVFLIGSLLAMWGVDEMPVVIWVLSGAAALRLLDILATATGIVLFEAQSRNFAGVASLQRSVLLGLANLAEIVVITAVLASAVEAFTESGAFSPPLRGADDALAVALGAVGVSGSSPDGAGALLVLAVCSLSLAYMVVLTVAVFVSNLTGSLRRDP